MSVFRPAVAWWVLPAVLLIGWCVLLPVGRAQEEEVTTEEAAESTEAAADPFEVPDGPAADLLTYIEGLANPTEQFESSEAMRDYLGKAAVAIGTATDRILAGEASVQETIDAVQCRLESLRIKEILGDQEAKLANDFLDGMKNDPRPEVVSAVKEISLVRALKRWPRLEPAERLEVVNGFVADVKAGEPSADQAIMLYRISDMLSDSPDSGLASRMIDELLPGFRKSNDEGIHKIVPILEGIARRINLPGNKIEIEGTLLDGTKIDWESYLGKVVLVDFWATDCGPCRAEVPNLLENYKLYHDKGFEVVGISLDRDRSQVEQYVREMSIPWPIMFQENPNADGWDHPVANKYAIDAIPRMILVDSDGKVAHVNIRGPMLGAELQRLLGAPAADQSSAVIDEDVKQTASNAAPTAP